MTELDNFLETPEAGKGQSDIATVAAETVTTDTKQANGKGDTSAATPAAETDESTAKTGEKHWSESAFYDEKRKRQELQRRLEELEKPKQEKPEEPDIFADPEGFKAKLRSDLADQAVTDRINLTREIYLENKPDFAEKEQHFVELAKTDPALINKMRQSANPAKFAYDTAAKSLERAAKDKLLEGVGDIEALRTKIAAEEREKVLAELGQSSAKPAKPLIEKAPSLATASAATSNTTVTPVALKDLFVR